MLGLVPIIKLFLYRRTFGPFEAAKCSAIIIWLTVDFAAGDSNVRVGRKFDRLGSLHGCGSETQG